MAINQADYGGAFGNALRTAYMMQPQRNMLAPQDPTYTAMEQNGGPTVAAANALADTGDWMRGRHEGVDPRLIEILSAVREETGIPFFITEGMRDRARQAEMVRTGKSQTMNSRHLHGNALDIAIPGEGGAINWDFEAYRPIAEAAKRKAMELGYDGFVWGGDWNTLKDGVHFQLG